MPIAIWPADFSSRLKQLLPLNQPLLFYYLETHFPLSVSFNVIVFVEKWSNKSQENFSTKV